MNKETNNYDVLINEIKTDLQKMANNEVNLQEAIELFEANLQKINALRSQLANYQLKVKRVLENNKIEDFEV